jgi:hypothetical protein
VAVLRRILGLTEISPEQQKARTASPRFFVGTFGRRVLRECCDKPARIRREPFTVAAVDAVMNSNLLFASPRAWTTAGVSLLGSALALGLAGCGHRPIIVQTPAPTVVQAPAPAPAIMTAPAPAPTPPTHEVIVVNQAPPPPQQESMSPQPSTEHVWIAGYWAWRNNQQQWVPGHWEIPARPGATWIPARWEQRGSEYVFIEGYWQ